MYSHLYAYTYIYAGGALSQTIIIVENGILTWFQILDVAIYTDIAETHFCHLPIWRSFSFKNLILFILPTIDLEEESVEKGA